MVFLGIELSLEFIVVLLAGTFAGLIFGAIPGLGPPITIAFMIPLFQYFPRTTAILLLGSTYVAGVYGGSISAILLNVPGTGASACTALDGYPMSQRGEAISALAISTTSSIIGGLISVTILYLATPVLTEFILLFGSPEYFMMVIVGLATIAIVSGGNPLKGLIAGFFGFAITSIGVASVTGEIRYTFGNVYLYDGVQFLPALIGIFAVTEMMRLAVRGEQIAGRTDLLGSPIEGVLTTLQYKWSLLRSSLVGFFVGVIPGAGGTVANFVAYGIANRRNTTEDEFAFGDGNPEGIVSAESSNNAMVAGSLVPSITFGIPGNSTTAVLIGALIYLGLQPGPRLFSQNLDSIYLLYLGVVIGCVFLFIMYFIGPYIGKVTVIDKGLLIPIILLVSTIATYSLRQSYGDVVQMLLFGALGYIMIRHNYSIIALILGIILGPTAERNLFRTLQISDNSLAIFVTRPISLILLIIAIFILSAAFSINHRSIYRFFNVLSNRLR